MNDVLTVIGALAIAILVFLIYVLFWRIFWPRKGGKHKGNKVKQVAPEPYKVIGIDGDTYVIMQVVKDVNGSKTITLIDQGTFDRQHREH